MVIRGRQKRNHRIEQTASPPGDRWEEEWRGGRQWGRWMERRERMEEGRERFEVEIEAKESWPGIVTVFRAYVIFRSASGELGNESRMQGLVTMQVMPVSSLGIAGLQLDVRNYPDANEVIRAHAGNSLSVSKEYLLGIIRHIVLKIQEDDVLCCSHASAIRPWNAEPNIQRQSSFPGVI
jgi:hypothetical protein